MKTPVNMDGPGNGYGTGHGGDTVTEIVAAVIREKSAASQLISESEILSLVGEERLSCPDTGTTGEGISSILDHVVRKNEDLNILSGTRSRLFYSSLHMTEAYANILFHKLDGPLRLIVVTVRQNARIYRRPVPLSMFAAPPFNLAFDRLSDWLTAIAATESCNDIAATTTSASGIYLYSTLHLEAEHAGMLAEWLDVGQSDNP